MDRDRDIMDMDYSWPTKSASSKTNKEKNKHSAAKEWAWQQDEQEEKAAKHRAKKNEHINRFTLFLLRKINTMHEFLSMHNTVYVSVRCMVVSVHEICEGLPQGSIVDPTLFYCKLMIFLIMLSVTLVSILIILFSTLSVMRHLICGNN